jgi:hypothetical protein
MKKYCLYKILEFIFLLNINSCSSVLFYYKMKSQSVDKRVENLGLILPQGRIKSSFFRKTRILGFLEVWKQLSIAQILFMIRHEEFWTYVRIFSHIYFYLHGVAALPEGGCDGNRAKIAKCTLPRPSFTEYCVRLYKIENLFWFESKFTPLYIVFSDWNACFLIASGDFFSQGPQVWK